MVFEGFSDGFRWFFHGFCLRSEPRAEALISWGLAKLSFKADAAFEALCDAAVQQIEHFAPQNLVPLDPLSGLFQAHFASISSSKPSESHLESPIYYIFLHVFEGERL